MYYRNLGIEEAQIYGGNAPDGDANGMTTENTGEMNLQELPIEKKLQLAERANEIYREQVKYLQDHLNGMRGLVQEKEYIIENLTLRYDMGILPLEEERPISDANVDRELRRKAEALAQRTILENFELREFVNDLREENFNLKNDAYDLQDQLNRHALYITKLTKNAQQFQIQMNPQQFQTPMNPFPQGMEVTNDENTDALAQEALQKREERARKHNRQQSSIPEPQGFWGEDDDGAKTEAALLADPTQGPLTTQQMFGNEEERGQEDGNKNEEEAGKNTDDINYANKRRGSKQWDEDPRNTEEAKKIREERAKRVRQESIAVPKNFLHGDNADDSEDDESREKRIKHQRKQSLIKAVGDKGHLSDEDTEKKQRVDYQTRRKVDRISRQRAKEAKAGEKTETSAHHRRDSSMPMPDLGFDAPAPLLSVAQEEVKLLKEQLGTIQEEKKLIEKQLQDAKIEAEQREFKLGKELEKRIEQKFQQEKSGLIATSKEELQVMHLRINELKDQLSQAANSKLNLIQCTNNEINRLNRVINTLLQSKKCQEITRLLLDDCQNYS